MRFFLDGRSRTRLHRSCPPQVHHRQCAFLEESGSDNLHRPDINIQGHRFY